MVEQRRFDITQLDADAANLDLIVDTAGKLKHAVGAQPAHIARAIQLYAR